MWGVEILERWATLLPTFGPIGLLGAAVAVGAMALRHRVRPAAWSLLVLSCAAIGAAELWRRLSLVDDAWISFRYVRNLLRGDGLVFNPGEAVLGITNLGWTLLVAVITGLTGADIPHVGLVCGALAWVALIAVTWHASRALDTSGDTPPLAASLVAVSWLVCSFGSTGLETVCAAALVVGGFSALLRDRFGWAGLWLVLAAIVRLDHGLFLAFGGLVALRRGGLPWFLAASPLLAAALGWTWWTYGEPWPNTVHAKAGGPYFSQGGFYVWSFWLTTQLVWVGPLALWGGLARGASPVLREGVVPAVIVWNLYVAFVGGDFMIGRFLVPCIPLVLLCCEHAVARSSGRRALVLAGWMGLTAYGAPLIVPRNVEWYLADEGTIYPVRTVSPVEVDHHSWKMGNALKRTLTDRGLRPTIAAHGIGMIGYYSDLPLVDFLGLVDPVTARLPVRHRGRPGHEKHADADHVKAKGALLSQLPPYRPLERYTGLRPRPPNKALKSWHIWQWDPALREIREAAPELGILDFEGYVSDRIRDLHLAPPNRARQDLELFDRVWYGQPGVDDSTRALFVEAASRPDGP